MKIILMGEPMGLFMANESGSLCEANTFTASIAGAEYNVAVGLARLGSHIGHGSGEVFVAFSTANPFDFRAENAVRMTTAFHDELLDLPFRAAAECAEEAVLNSMLTAHTVTGWQGNTVYALPELWRPGV